MLPLSKTFLMPFLDKVAILLRNTARQPYMLITGHCPPFNYSSPNKNTNFVLVFWFFPATLYILKEISE